MTMTGMTPVRRILTPALGLALVLLAAAAGADDDHDHDRARAAVQAGQVLPLKTLLEHLAREHPGQLLAVELEEEDGLLVYEVRVLQADGRLVKLKVDAATGDVLRQPVRPGERTGKPGRDR